MVHSIRLVWFALYGSYPTGHSEMGRVLTGGDVVPDWAHGGLKKGNARISACALKGAIAEGLNREDLPDRLCCIGSVFFKAGKLRNDSNYESLLLAHQYCHRISRDWDGTGVDVARSEFQKAGECIHTAMTRVHQFVVELLLASFDDANDWYCPRDKWDGTSLLATVLYIVKTAIVDDSSHLENIHSWQDDPFSLLFIKCKGIKPRSELFRTSSMTTFQ
jgi:hypothetical protein